MRMYYMYICMYVRTYVYMYYLRIYNVRPTQAP